MKHINKLYNRDLILANTLRCTGCITHKNLETIFKPTRINTYIRDNLIQKEDGNYYRLTKHGKDFYRKQLGFNNFYSFRSQKHDLKLQEKVFNVVKNNPNATFYTERDTLEEYYKLIDHYREENNYIKANELLNKEYSCPDFVYKVVTEEQEVITFAYEVITKNYKEEEIVAKETVCKELNYKLEMERI